MDRSSPSVPAPACWVVTDGRAGLEAQALGLAEAVARRTPLSISVKRVRLRAPLSALPARLVPAAFAESAGDPIPWAAPPDLWIGCGRQATPLSVRARTAPGAPFVVQIQTPDAPLSRFDLVVAPEHDGLRGPTVELMLGAPNRITPERIAAEAAPLRAVLGARPVVAVMLGGPNAAYAYDAEDARAVRAALQAVRAAGYGLWVTASRRTPPALFAALRADGTDSDRFFDPEASDGPNPYPGLLGLAQAALVAPDSVNMLGEAATAGLPVYALPLTARRRAKPKFERFLAALFARGCVRPFAGVVERWAYPRLAETDRIAGRIAERLAQRRAGGTL